MDAQVNRVPKIFVRKRLTVETPHVTSGNDGLEQVIADLVRGRTPGLRKYFERHCRNPQIMKPRTLWYLYLLRLKYQEEGQALHARRLAVIKDILSNVPQAITNKVMKPVEFDPTAFHT